MQEVLQNWIRESLKNLGIETELVSLEHPADLSHGDYSTNAALAYGKSSGRSPRALAELLLMELQKDIPHGVERIEIAGPGFINFHLSREYFVRAIEEVQKKDQKWGSNESHFGMKVMVEYTQPNPFKPFHIGHLMSNAIGESISRIIEFSGAETVRANYQGDIGLHVGKSIYGLMKRGRPDANLSVSEQAEYIGSCYSWASELYESDVDAKAQIDAINKKVYDKSDPEINELYGWGRKLTLEAFEDIYKTLGTKFDYYFFESEMAEPGSKIVRENTPGIFEESDGAIVFHAEAHDPKLHTRVFITKQGLPTYEAKEIGLTMKKFDIENPDLSIVTTAVEQADYMKVVEKAMELISPTRADRMKHITHGMMRFASGKMSSRKGNVITGKSLLEDSMAAIGEKVADREFDEELKKEISRVVGVGALKFSVLHQAIGGNIVYDAEKSVSLEGDSGPYLQYSATRAASVLKKAQAEGVNAGYHSSPLDPTVLERILYRFPEVVERARETFEPHHIATFLVEIAGAFNSFYASHPIVQKEDPYSPYKVALTEAFLLTIKNGLWLLGIETPERM